MEIEILHPERLRAWCERLGYPSNATETLEAVASRVRSDSTLEQFFAEFYEKTSLKGEWHREWDPLPFDPLVVGTLGDQASLFYLLAYMAALPHAEKQYRRRKIAPAIFDDTMQDLSTWLCHRYDLDGKWSFDQFMWVWRHLTCELFRIGRLQYVHAPFEGGVTALRNKNNRQVILLVDPEIPLRPDGYAAGAGHSELQERPPEGPSWSATFTASDEGWHGHLVSPYGFVCREPAFYARSDWELALQRGDAILDIHIPRSGPFTVDACRDSIHCAQAFFAEQFPQQPVKALFCHTWFFTPQLQQILPPHSNIVRFQREFYLYPFPGGPGFLWGFVFGEKHTSLADAPRDTFLRARVIEWLEQGHELFDLPGVAFHGPEEWGTQPYMSDWDSKNA